MEPPVSIEDKRNIWTVRKKDYHWGHPEGEVVYLPIPFLDLLESGKDKYFLR